MKYFQNSEKGPMSRLTQKTDSKGRVSLPKSFANSTVVIEQISDRELRICKVQVFPKDEIRFAEENPLPLSDRDRDLFLKLLDQPPPPPAALRHLLKQKAKKSR
jgi:DNA-binding transcriptional regulator/RsmH inhibitor MraZ